MELEEADQAANIVHLKREEWLLLPLYFFVSFCFTCSNSVTFISRQTSNKENTLKVYILVFWYIIILAYLLPVGMYPQGLDLCAQNTACQEGRKARGWGGSKSKGIIWSKVSNILSSCFITVVANTLCTMQTCLLQWQLLLSKSGRGRREVLLGRASTATGQGCDCDDPDEKATARGLQQKICTLTKGLQILRNS